MWGISIEILSHKPGPYFTRHCKDIAQRLHPKWLQANYIDSAIPFSLNMDYLMGPTSQFLPLPLTSLYGDLLFLNSYFLILFLYLHTQN